MPVLERNVETVERVADLAATTLRHGQKVRTLGYHVADDGGANEYRYDASSTATCNGGFVLDGIGGSNITPGRTATTWIGTGKGRLIATDQRVANVRQFGSLADDSSNDSFRLQAAIDTTRPVFLPDGTYAITGTLTIATHRQKFYGNGLRSVIRNLITDGSAGIRVNDVDFVSLEDFEIRGPDDTTPNTTNIHLDSANRWYAKNVSSRYAARGFNFDQAFIGNGANLWARYTTVGAAITEVNASHIELMLENCSQPFSMHDCIGSSFHMLIEGENQASINAGSDEGITTTCPVDGCYSINFLTLYIELQPPIQNTVPAITIGELNRSYSIRVLNGHLNESKSGLPTIVANLVDGFTFKGTQAVAGVATEQVRVTSNAKNIEIDTLDINPGGGGDHEIHPSHESLRPVRTYLQDPYWANGTPAVTDFFGAVSSEETALVPVSGDRVIKIEPGVGQTFAQSRYSEPLTDANGLLGKRGQTMGLMYSVYVPSNSYWDETYPSSLDGPAIEVRDNLGAQLTPDTNEYYAIGQWRIVTTEFTIPAAATSLEFRLIANKNSRPPATATEAAAYFGGVQVFDGGNVNAHRAVNGRTTPFRSVNRKAGADSLGDDTTSIDFDAGGFDNKEVMYTADQTLALSATRAGDYTILVKSDDGSPRTMTWPANVQGSPPTVFTATNGTPVRFYSDGTNLHYV